MNDTIKYYEKEYETFISETIDADTEVLRRRFLRLIPGNGDILDLGCGSGRDTKAFIDKGFTVDAIDGSMELCALASEYTGIDVKCMDFMQVECHEKYDAVWACASMLHIGSDMLPELINKLRSAIKPNGIWYMSFKYGDFEGERDGRFFVDMTSEKFRNIIDRLNGWSLVEEWDSEDVRRGKNVKWYNVIIRKE